VRAGAYNTATLIALEARRYCCRVELRSFLVRSPVGLGLNELGLLSLASPLLH
jgi:hypothetical protein